MTTKHCCADPAWSEVADLGFLRGDLEDHDAAELVLEKCRSCEAHRLKLSTREGLRFLVPLPPEEAAGMTEAHAGFRAGLRSWARS